MESKYAVPFAAKCAVLHVVLLVTIMSSSTGALAGSYDTGAFHIANKAEADIDVRCIALAAQQDIWEYGEINLAIGSKWEERVCKQATSVRCTFGMLGMLAENLPVWERMDFACSDCHWIVDKNGFSVLNPAKQQYILVARWTPPGI